MGKDFGRKLKLLRLKKNVTQVELAKLLNISPSAVGMYEQGRREPDSKILQKLCSILDTTTDYLLGVNTSTDINAIFDDFTKRLASEEGLMFNGKPVTREDKQKVINSVKLALEYVKAESKN